MSQVLATFYKQKIGSLTDLRLSRLAGSPANPEHLPGHSLLFLGIELTRSTLP